MVSMGFTEGTAASVGCLWNANILIGPDGTILNHHRKLVPTFYEKLIWANGDGWGLRVADTRIGRIGTLICGENTNPLARFALMAQGEQIHIATYPPVWPTRATQQGNYDLEQAIRIRAGGHSFEAKVFTIVTSAVYDKSARAALTGLSDEARRVLEEAPRAVSLIFGPTGTPVSEILCADEGILYATLDLAECVEPKQLHDVVGYYNRFDIFKLRIDRTRTAPAVFEDQESAVPPRATQNDLQENSATVSGLDAQRPKLRGH
jgi:aliphatic nitrilase